MKKYLAVLLIVLFTSLCFAFDVPEGFVKVTEDCYLELSVDAEGKETGYGTLHFRGKIYGSHTYVIDIYGAISEIEGIKSVSPRPYEWMVARGQLYTWDEILEDVAVVLTNAKKKASAEAAKKAKEKGLP